MNPVLAGCGIGSFSAYRPAAFHLLISCFRDNALVAALLTLFSDGKALLRPAIVFRVFNRIICVR